MGKQKVPEKLSGIVAEAESYKLTIEPFTSGVILRPLESGHFL